MSFEKQGKTFLSYSRVNKDFAVRLAKELKAEGFDVWLDQLDIPAGSRWDREVEKALRNSEIFMIILTAASVDSENVLDEIGYAIDSNKRFLPVLLEKCDVPLRLRRFQYVDFTNKTFDDGVESAKELLRGLIAHMSLQRGAVTDQQAEEVEAKRKAKEDADRLVEQKAEEERLARQKAEEELAAKARADREAKVEVERKAREEADRLAAQKAELARREKEKLKPAQVVSNEIKVGPVPVTPAQKKPIPMGLMIGIGVVAVLVIAGIGINALRKTPAAIPATEAPVASASATKAKPSSTLKPTNTPKPTSTPIPMPVVLSISDAKQLSDSGSTKGFYSLARDQYTVDQLTNFSDNNQPIPLTLTESIPLRLGWSTCAKTQDILEDNLQDVIYTFKFMDKTLPESNYGNDDYTADNGDACRVTYIVIDKWVTGQYNAYQGAEQTKTINNGYEDVEPFTQEVKFTVTVP